MKVLFVVASPEYLRYYDTTMKALAARGHQVSVGVTYLRERKHARLDVLLDDARIEILGQVAPRADMWGAFARAVRGSWDFIRYLHPTLAGATALRQRMKRKSAPAVIHWLDRYPSLDPSRLERLYVVLRLAEAAVPVDRRLVTLLQDRKPDLLVVSPLVDSRSEQVDLVRAGRAAGIPVVLGVASWDNLTNKGHIRVVPDVVTVWNEHQKSEAVSLHGVPPERVRVTGAQLFDRWFERTTSQSREAFCVMVGLPPDKPIVLYTGSSVFIARSEFEVPFVRNWIAAIRSSAHPELRDASILIRPHPFNCDSWEHAEFPEAEYGRVVVWPRQRYTPAAESARDSFFDSLYYSEAVVGINTSAMIEATILRKPVLSLLTPEFAGTQEGTVHFHYLLPENGGPLRVASSVEQHVDQLAEVLRFPESVQAQLTRFVTDFLRPHGLDQPATPILADALEQGATLLVVPAPEGLDVRIARLLLWPVAALTSLFSSSLDADGRPSSSSWDTRLDRRSERFVKQFVIRPWRASGRLIRGALRVSSRVGRRVWRASLWSGRRILRVPYQLLRIARHVRYHVAVRLRSLGRS